jgi:hypothetical protein
MYEPHKDNLERVARESGRLADIEQRCQRAIREILAEAKLDARITFYPKTVRKIEMESDQYAVAVPQEGLDKLARAIASPKEPNEALRRLLRPKPQKNPDWDKLREEVNTRFSRVLAYLARS